MESMETSKEYWCQEETG